MEEQTKNKSELDVHMLIYKIGYWKDKKFVEVDTPCETETLAIQAVKDLDFTAKFNNDDTKYDYLPSVVKRDISDNDDKEKQILSELDINQLSQLLLNKHIVGDELCSESDFTQIQFRAKVTLEFCKYFINNVKGTDEERIEYIQDIWDDILKFKINKK